MLIYPDHHRLQYCGRIDFVNPKEPVFVFPCTSVRMRFTGGQLRVCVKNRNNYWENYAGCILDGKQYSIKLNREGETVKDLSDVVVGDGAHELLLFKRQDSCHEMTFCGFELAEGAEVLPLPPLPELKLEVYGDSVSAGEVSEAVEYVGCPDPEQNGEYSNSWYSYAWMTARKLGAQIHDIAQGGAALLNGIGWFCEPDYIGMEYIWDKIHYNPTFGEATPWEFSKYTPDAVIVAVGQNDSHPVNFMAEDYDGEAAAGWRDRYKAFLQELRFRYPAAQIICCTTLLEHDAAWDRAIGQVCAELADIHITQYLFRRNGTGTPGHLRIPEAEEMAEELAAYIRQRLSLQI